MVIAIIVICLAVAAAIFATYSEKYEKTYCDTKDREAEACIEVYDPVCGWFDSDKVQCIKYPCAETFGNSCFSCLNPDVAYYTKGECPE